MIPLTMASVGEVVLIIRIGGKKEIKRHLEPMGFVPGTHIIVIPVNNGNVIVGIKESRVAISKETANKIMV